ncbi:MAG TPA: hypothetical protein VHC01_12420 [Gaiellaceae bacterium]|nr:hypothetical protein [Gaiellaceae bacterium]
MINASEASNRYHHLDHAGHFFFGAMLGLLLGSLPAGVFHRRPTVLAHLTRRQTPLPAHGNETTLIEMSLNQDSHPANRPADCVPFTARWAGLQRTAKPRSSCIAPSGGIYVRERVYPLTAGAARFAVGR